MTSMRTLFFEGNIEVPKDLEVVSHSDPVIQKTLNTPDAAEYEIKYNPKTKVAQITFLDVGPGSSVASMFSRSDYTISGDVQLSRFVHDFTFEPLFGSTDCGWSTVFEHPLQDQDSKLTPDYLGLHPDLDILCVEFKTHYGDSDRALMAEYRLARLKYLRPLTNRVMAANRKAYFSILAASHTTVVSDRVLKQDLVDAITYRYRLALSISFALGTDYQWFIPDDNDKKKRMLREEIESILPKNGFGDGRINEQVYQIIMASTDEKDFEESMTIALDWAQDYLLTACKERSIEQSADTYMIYDTTGFRDEKNWINYPCLVPNNSEGIPSVLPLCEMSRLWSVGLIAHEKHRGQYRMPSDDKYEHAKKNEKPEEYLINLNKRQSNRFTIDFSEKEALFHASHGVRAKQQKLHPSLKGQRDKTQTPIHTSNPTEILEWMSNNMKWFFGKSDFKDLSIDLLKEADWLANKVHEGHKEPVSKAFYELSETNGITWLTLLADVATEVNVSINQHCRSNEFIIKKLLRFNCYIIVKPTTNKSHIFYTLCFPKPIKTPGPGIFKNMFEFNSVFCTNWHSLQIDKMQNMITAPQIFINAWFTFKRHVDEDPSNLFQFDDLQTFQHAFMCLLIAIEDKTETEELVTLSRYAYMESHRVEPYLRCPAKIMKKVSFRPMTRLAEFMTHQLVRLCKKIEDQGAVPTTDDERVFLFNNMWSLFTLEPIKSFEMCLDISSSGYFKNKHSKSEGNQAYKLLKKIIKCEDTVDDIDFDKFYEHKTDPKEHEFDLTTVQKAADVLVDELRKMYGNNVIDKIGDEFLTRASQITYMDLGTLKASCTADPSIRKAPADEKTARQATKREKLLIVVMKAIEQKKAINMCPFLELAKWLTLAESTNLIIDIFKKAQHGGLREIYVQSIESRVCQLFIELLSRVICELIPSEAMTHPKEKANMPGNHAEKVRKVKALDDKNDVFTRRMNDDAKTWSNTHYAPKFYITLCRLTPSWLHPVIARILNLWVGRQLLIPFELIKVLRSNPNTPYQDPMYQRISDVFHGRDQATWLKPGEQWLKVRGGMMQGILHYTSSVFHCSLQVMVEKMARSYIKVHHPQLTLIYSHQTSSDDSGVIATLVGHVTDEAKRMLELLLMMKWSLGKLMAIYPSIEKSTPLTQRIYEFNSDYYCRTGRLRPTIRWVASALVILETETLIERQEHFTNLRTQVIEGGGPIMLSRVINLSQGILHYRLLGSSINECFERFAEDLRNYPEPHYGFFLLDPAKASGCVPFAANHWYLCFESNCGYDYVEEMKETSKLDTSARSVRLTFCSYGNYTKMRKLVDKISTEDWEAEIEKDPTILLRRPKTLKEIAILLSDKLHNPGVVMALATSNIISKLIASGVYMINCPAMGTRSNIFDEHGRLLSVEEMRNNKRKFSLAYLLGNQKGISRRADPADLKLLFPAADSYAAIFATNQELMHENPLAWQCPMKTRSYVRVLEVVRDTEYSLEELCRHYWAGITLRSSKHFIDEEFKMSQLIHPWLRLKIEDSLAESSFETYREMIGFIKRREARSKRLIVNGAPTQGDCSLEYFCRRNQWSGVLYEKVPLVGRAGSLRVMDNLKFVRHGLAMLLNANFLPNKSKIETIKEYLDSLSPEVIEALERGSKHDLTILAFLAYFQRKQKMDIIEQIRIAKRGLIGAFTLPQTWNSQSKRYEGDGVWEGQIDDEKVVIHFFDARMVHVFIKDRPALENCLGSIRTLCKEAGFIPDFYGLGEKRGVVIRSDFKIADYARARGTEVTFDKFIASKGVFVPSRSNPIRVACNERTIRLTQKQGGRQLTILSWTPKPYHLQRVLPEKKWFKIKEELVNTWIMGESLSPQQAGSVLEMARTYRNNERDFARNRHWMVTQATECAQDLGWCVGGAKPKYFDDEDLINLPAFTFRLDSVTRVREAAEDEFGEEEGVDDFEAQLAANDSSDEEAEDQPQEAAQDVDRVPEIEDDDVSISLKLQEAGEENTTVVSWYRVGAGTNFFKSFLYRMDQSYLGGVRAALKSGSTYMEQVSDFCDIALGKDIYYEAIAPGPGEAPEFLKTDKGDAEEWVYPAPDDWSGLVDEEWPKL
uniref:RNA-directed RNA polymerase L n=1 Tax=Wuhan Insect virus 1 TaxID=1608106 RepID=A0A0B5KRZ1_9VIRU|nr:RNA-dependent RNA polymerase [Wuhan Insect virus 1]